MANNQDLQLAIKIQAFVKGLEDVAAMSAELDGLAQEAGVPVPDNTAALRAGAGESAGALGELRDSVDRAATGVDEMGDSADRTTPLMGEMAGAIGKVAAAGLTLGALAAAMRGAIEESANAEARMLKLEGVVRATGGAAGFTAGEIRELSGELALATLGNVQGFEDAAAALLTFRRVSGDAFTRALELSQDLASVMGSDIKGAAVQLGKALEDPARGLSALAESGVSFSVAQMDQIKAMNAAGDAAGAHALILDEVARQVGGVARSMAGGLAGAQDTVAQRWEELNRAMGDAINPAAIRFNEALAVTLEAVAANLGTIGVIAKQLGIGVIAAFALKAAPAVAAFTAQTVLATKAMLGLGAATTTAAAGVGLLGRAMAIAFGKFALVFVGINALIELGSRLFAARDAANETAKSAEQVGTKFQQAAQRADQAATNIAQSVREKIAGALITLKGAAQSTEEAFDAIGIDPEKIETGIGKAERTIIESFKRIAADPNVRGDVLLSSLLAALDQVGTRAVPEIGFAFKVAANAGRQSTEQLGAGLNALKTKADGLWDGMADGLKKLGDLDKEQPGLKYLERARALRDRMNQPAEVDKSIEGQALAMLGLIAAEEKLLRIRGQGGNLEEVERQAALVRQLAGGITDQTRAREALNRSYESEAVALEKAAAEEVARQQAQRVEFEKTGQEVRALGEIKRELSEPARIVLETEEASARVKALREEIASLRDTEIRVRVVPIGPDGRVLAPGGGGLDRQISDAALKLGGRR